jgi:hypothetical protein
LLLPLLLLLLLLLLVVRCRMDTSQAAQKQQPAHSTEMVRGLGSTCCTRTLAPASYSPFLNPHARHSGPRGQPERSSLSLSLTHSTAPGLSNKRWCPMAVGQDQTLCHVCMNPCKRCHHSPKVPPRACGCHSTIHSPPYPDPVGPWRLPTVCDLCSYLVDQHGAAVAPGACLLAGRPRPAGPTANLLPSMQQAGWHLTPNRGECTRQQTTPYVYASVNTAWACVIKSSSCTAPCNLNSPCKLRCTQTGPGRKLKVQPV